MIEVRTLAEVREEVGDLLRGTILEATKTHQWTPEHDEQLNAVLDAICLEWFRLVDEPRARSRKQPMFIPVTDGSVEVRNNPDAIVYAIDFSAEPTIDSSAKLRAADVSGIYFSRFLNKPVRYDEIWIPVLITGIEIGATALINLITSGDAANVTCILGTATVGTISAFLARFNELLKREGLTDPLERCVCMIALNYCQGHSGRDDEFTTREMTSWFRFAGEASRDKQEIKERLPWISGRAIAAAKKAYPYVCNDASESCDHVMKRFSSIGLLSTIEAADGKSSPTYRINQQLSN